MATLRFFSGKLDNDVDGYHYYDAEGIESCHTKRYSRDTNAASHRDEPYDPKDIECVVIETKRRGTCPDVRSGFVNVRSLQGFPNLKTLIIRKMWNVEGLSELPSLEKLVIGNTSSVSLRGIENCPRLRSLVVDDTLAFRDPSAKRSVFTNYETLPQLKTLRQVKLRVLGNPTNIFWGLFRCLPWRYLERVKIHHYAAPMKWFIPGWDVPVSEHPNWVCPISEHPIWFIPSWDVPKWDDRYFYCVPKKLRTLVLEGVRVRDPTDILSCFNLEELTLIDAQITQFEKLEKLQCLKKLSIGRGPIKTLSMLPQTLLELRLEMVEIEHLDLDECPRLERLTLESSSTKRIAGVLSSLKSVNLYWLDIDDLEFLKDTPLKDLILCDCPKIERVPPLRDIESLLVSHCEKIREISSLPPSVVFLSIAGSNSLDKSDRSFMGNISPEAHVYLEL